MKFKLEFDCDNAAFDPPEWEIVLILEKIRKDINTRNVPVMQGITVPIRDSNGNTIGEWRVTQ